MFFGILLLSHLTSHGSLALAQAVGKSGASGQAQAVVASTPQGTWIQAWYSNQPPRLTGEQQREIEERTTRSHRSGPISPTTTAPVGTVPGPTAPPLAPPISGVSDVSAMPGDFIIFRDSVIPNAVSSFVQEPSTSANGKNVFQVGNWYAARSFDNGATWSFLDPFSIFGPDFCCDQVTVYDPGRDRQFWLLQYGDHLAIAHSSGTDLFTNWCVYNIDPTWIGQPATTALDYNDLALGTNFLYLTTNIFPAAGGAGSAILRLPIDALITCGAFGYNYTVHTDSFTFKPVQGAQDVMYWGSNWGQVDGQSFRVYSWAENSGTYFWFDRTIDPFTFMYRNSGQNCGSTDGVVTNWCQFADSRVLSGYRANGILGFSFNASQGSGFPYSRRVYFRESDIAYLGSASLWADWTAIQYLQLTPNARGHVGGVFAWGGHDNQLLPGHRLAHR